MDNKNSTKINKDFLILLYQITIDDIRTTKRHQWTITYYALLLLAAVIGFYKLLSAGGDGVSCLGKWILISLSVIISILGTIYLVIFQKTLIDYRKRLIRIREYFPEDINVILGEVPSNYRSFNYYFGNVVLPFILILWIGAALIIWLIFKQ